MLPYIFFLLYFTSVFYMNLSVYLYSYSFIILFLYIFNSFNCMHIISILLNSCLYFPNSLQFSSRSRQPFFPQFAAPPFLALCLRGRSAFSALKAGSQQVLCTSLFRFLRELFCISHDTHSAVAFPLAFKYPPVTPILKYNKTRSSFILTASSSYPPISFFPFNVKFLEKVFHISFLYFSSLSVLNQL